MKFEIIKQKIYGRPLGAGLSADECAARPVRGGGRRGAAKMPTRIEEVKKLVEDCKTQVFRDLVMKRHSKTREDEKKWFANFDSDLESYVGRRIELALLEKGRP